jgi:uncharacterized protein YjiS (DUF1127 family)
MAANPTLGNAPSARSSSSAQSPLGGLLHVRNLIVGWIDNWQARRYLDDLDDRLLLDVGFDPGAARAEAAKPFWKPLTLTAFWQR